jgi:cytochrome P450
MMQSNAEKPAEDAPQAAPGRLLMLQYSELNPDMRADPHALFDPQRAERPVEHDGFLPAVMITSYEHGRGVLRDRELSRNFDYASPDNPVISHVLRLNAAVADEFGPHKSMLTLDDPDHARVRGIVAEAFLKRAASAQDNIGVVVDRVLGELKGRTGFDVVGDYAGRIPISVLGPILGCAPEHFADLKRWTEAGSQAFDPTGTADAANAAIEGRRGILGHFRMLMQAREQSPDDDLVTDLLRAQAEGAPINEHEILHNLFALLVAGHLTTADLIGNGVHLLLTHLEARDAILTDPHLIVSAVDEILRYEPPISTTARFPKDAGSVGGCPYKGGDALTVSLVASNRDPAKFKDPHAFDIRREGNAHLAFGAGAHICIGAPLARVEAQTAILRLLQTYPRLRKAEDGPADWRAVAGVRGLARLDVVSE